MDLQKRVLRTCAMVIIGALALRFLGGPALQLLQKPQMTSLLLYLETGRYIRTEAPEHQQNAQQSASIPTQYAGAVAVFSQSDKQNVQIRNNAGYSVDVAAMLQEPLSWDLTGDEPTVLILHTHATEGYQNTGNSSYRTQDNRYNMLSIGAKITELLEAGGIHVIHDTTLHDHPSYNDAYYNARQTIEKQLDQHPSIKLILDLHRDALTNSSGQQIGQTVDTPSGTAAKVMVVVGTDAGGLNHPNWAKNLSLAVKLHAQLEKCQPGICRPLNFRAQRYNQDMFEGAVLIEVGAAGNTHDEAMVSCQYIAQAILALAYCSRAA